ncbi:AraC family transcriptional regulator [Geodermatophilus sp. SYSU D01119]
MDALTGLLEEVRSSGALFGRNVVSPPWSVHFAEEAPLTLVAMLRGSGWLVPGDADPVPLDEGGLAVVVGRRPFTVAHDRDGSAPPLYVLLPGDRCTTADGAEAGEDLRLGVRTCGADLDGPTVVLSGTYQVRGQVSARLVQALPRVLAVAPTGQLRPLLDLTETEIEREEPGQQAVLDRLLDLLLLSTLREWFARPDVEPPAWYRALGDPVVGRALRLLHAAPARPWTVAGLAAEVGVSRATLARRFGELVGEPPMTYLTGWRLCLAADLLASTDDTVQAVARRVGYESAFGLSVAFKRVYGTRPSRHRASAGA